MQIPERLDFINHRSQFLSTVAYIETDKGSGTGFVITKDGYLLTCAHVVKECLKIYVKITLESGIAKIYKANIIATNKEIDYALLKMEEFEGNFVTIETHDSPCAIGDEIVILGYPFGKKVGDDIMDLSISFTKGYISSIQKQNSIARTLLDIAAKAGNSGSPVIHMATGQVVGLLCGSITNKNNSITEEINYMSPIQYFWDEFTIN